jgi:hypothetical protein
MRRVRGKKTRASVESRLVALRAGLSSRLLVAIRAGLSSVLLVAFAACSDVSAPIENPRGEFAAAQLELGGGNAQRIWSGRRSTEPFRVRALDASGKPLPGAIVHFTLEGSAGGVLSQPRAVTDGSGFAETFLLETKSGEGVLTAKSGDASVRFTLAVDRAPGEIRFSPVSGLVGVPGLPHPDDLVEVRVFDTEGRALPGTEVWFVGPERVTQYADTTDANGWASTRIAQSQMQAGNGEVWAFVLGFPEVTAKTDRPVAAAARRVILMSIDGLRGDAIARYRPPTLSMLAASGGVTTTAQTVTPALSTPAHLSMLSGVNPDKHGIFGDNLSFTPEMSTLDPLFRRAGKSGFRAHAFVSREGPMASFEDALSCKLAFGLDSLTFVGREAASVASAAIPTVRDTAIGLVFMDVPDPDRAGHEHGFTSPEYGRAVMAADSAVARVIAAMDEHTLLIVTSDHGGGGALGDRMHGSMSDEDMLIPILFWGAHVKPSALGAASILDVPATALWALGIRPPAHYQGRVLLEAFR